MRASLTAWLASATLVAAGTAYVAAQAKDRPTVDPVAADRGRTIWAAECVDCHGSQARGTASGPNLIRSLVILKDRQGSELGPFLKNGHKTKSVTSGAMLTDDQMGDLANFILQRVNDTLRGSPVFKEQDILTGDAKSGADYFNGAGKCASCHGGARSLSGIASRYDAVTIQQRVLFPIASGGRRGVPNPNPVTVTVTPASGAPMSGVLVQLDDFTVSLRDSSGLVHTLARSPSLKVVKTDPLDAHHALLDTITDKNLHDVVAYLETLK
jgi:mono/diheme cytochrome c family protein